MSNKKQTDEDILDNEDEHYLSRTAQKKLIQSYKELAQKLINLNPTKINEIDISGDLLDAVLTAKKLKSGNALRRQLSYISKLIQNGENEKNIQETFLQIEKHDANHKKITELSESWRERLLSDDENALSDFISKVSPSDRQQFNQAIRNAKKEQSKKSGNNSENKHYKHLFNMIRQLLLNT